MTVFATHNADPAADEVRVETLRGREWLVAPVVLVREGVLNGGFLGFDEIQKSAPGWNGQPVTAPPDTGTEAANMAPSDPSGHPIDGQTDDGFPNFVSANQTPFVEQMHVGLVLNAEARTDLPTPGDEMSERGLVGEAWIDLAAVEVVGSFAVESVERIATGEELDVSTGYFHRPVERQGTHDGERYEAEQVDLLPDHLALLPNERGACSWPDGCGTPYPAANSGPLGDVLDGDTAGATAQADGPEGLVGRATQLLTMAVNRSNSTECSAGPCSCGEHVGNDDEPEDGEQGGERTEPNANMTDYDINRLADNTAFDLETLREWDDDDLAALAETVEANDDGGDGNGDGSTDGGDGDGPAANEELLERLDALESQNEELREQFEAERNEKREALAETVAAHTDHEAEELVENTDEYPDAALETMADALGDDGTAQGYPGPQGNRVNYLGQAGATGDPSDELGDDAEDYTASVGALTSLDDRAAEGD